MDAVPEQRPFTPLGLPSDATESRCRHEVCSGANPIRTGEPNSVLFALHTVDIREVYPVLSSSSRHVSDRFSNACNESELVKIENAECKAHENHAYEVQERRNAGEVGANLPRFAMPMVTRAYLTGSLPNGQKVGFVAPYRPACEVELPQTSFKDAMAATFWFRGFLRETCTYATVDPVHVDFTIHTAHRFKGYIPDPHNPRRRKTFWYARMTFPNVTVMRKVAQKLRFGVREWRVGTSDVLRTVTFKVYEEGISIDDKFIDAYNLTPCGWHVAGNATRRFGAQREMLVDEEYGIDAARIRNLTARDVYTGIDPGCGYHVSIASLDCEMNSEKADMFPQSSLHKVIVVGVVFAFAGAPAAGFALRFADYVEYERHAFVVSKTPCAPLPGVIVHRFDDETDMLAAVRDELFVRKKVDVVLGHNIVTFDIKYMAERVPDESETARRFLRFGALLRDSLQLKMKPLVSQGAGSNKLWLLNGAGFVYVDTYLLSKMSNTKLSENSLSYVSRHFLQDEEAYVDDAGVHRVRRVPMAKFDMPYNLIPVAAMGGPADWRKLVAYCVQDCVLPLRLIQKWDSITDLIAQSRVITIPMATNVKVGQQQRVRNTLMRKAHQSNMVLNGVNEFVPWGERNSVRGVSAEGGFVLESVTGLHDLPVVVLDFASLYPSVQRAENLCWSTVIEDPHAVIPDGLIVKTYETKTGTFRFVQNVPGVFPEQLTDLLAVRQRAKDGMKDAAKGSAAWAQCNSRQLATKIVMNSGYGTANAQNGIMPCVAVGTVTCFVGRQLNQEAEQFCQTRYGTTTYYGDTDSIMVYFPEPDDVKTAPRKVRAQYAWAAGVRAQDELNAHFASKYAVFPPKTECENIYFPILLAGAKTYAGLKFEEHDIEKASLHLECPNLETNTGAGTVIMKGLRPVRRDVAAFLARMAKEVLHALFFDRPETRPGYVPPAFVGVGGAKARGNAAFWNIVHTYVERVCLQELPLSDYVITQELKEGYEKQAVVRPHVAVSYAREWAVPGSGFEEGERIPYVMVAEADMQRVRRPPSVDMRLRARAAEAIRSSASASAVAARVDADDVDVDADADVDGGGGKKWSEDTTTAGAHARHADEVAAHPDENSIDIEYYIDRGICSVLKQLFPDLVSAQSEIKRYAKSAMSLWRRYAEERQKVAPDRAKTALDRYLTSTIASSDATSVPSVRSKAFIQDAVRAIRPQLSHTVPQTYTVRNLVSHKPVDGSGVKVATKKRKIRVFDSMTTTTTTNKRPGPFGGLKLVKR